MNRGVPPLTTAEREEADARALACCLLYQGSNSQDERVLAYLAFLCNEKHLPTFVQRGPWWARFAQIVERMQGGEHR